MPATVIRVTKEGDPVRALYQYFRNLPVGRAVLWCYLIWYGVVVIRYFDWNPRIWITSAGISAVIGVALMLSVSTSSGTKPDRWQTFRLFAMPFCVSSFSALVKDRGFILIMPSKAHDIALVLGCCAAFCILLALMRLRPVPSAARAKYTARGEV